MVQSYNRYGCCNNNPKFVSASRAGVTGTPFPVRSHRHAVPVATRRPYVARRQNRRASGPTTLQARAGLLNFFLPPKQSTNKQGQAQLVNDILRLASQTNSGANASQEQRQEITQLAEQLQEAGGVESPVHSDLTWGDYEVSYSSKPQAAGGPILRSLPGQFLFANQQLRQTLIPPNTLVNAVSFKCLGLFPGKATQPAVIQPLTGNTYKITVEPATIYGIKLGPESAERTFEVLYLDEREHEQGNLNSMFSTWADNVRGLASLSKPKIGLATQAERRFSKQKSAAR